MPAPALPNNPTLDELREQIAFTKIALGLEAPTQAFAAPFDALLVRHVAVRVELESVRDAQTRGGLKVRRADRRLDASVGGFVRDLEHKYGSFTAPEVQHYLRGRTATEIKRTVLGPETVIVGQWLPSIAKEKSKTLRAWGAVFEANLAEAEAATAESSAADTNNRVFRERGPLAEFVAELVAARETAHLALDDYRIANKPLDLPTDWSRGFFKPPRVSTPTADARKAQADAKAVRRLKAEQDKAARAEALRKFREARDALRALSKK